ncbi:DUF4157 domain-containing protein [Saccharothrix sp. BKS2]|uniref:eCIS core domain-containing protein n=1 Tax=Saccharothrix sp. BKS2 TaxID=3064400 RepID=UPI0039EB0EE5
MSIHRHDSELCGNHAQRTPAPPVPALGGLLALQRQVGNAAVAGMIDVLRASSGSPAAEDEQQQENQVRSVLGSAGRPLDEPVRQDMEARFRADFSEVRVHTDTVAQRSAQQVGARAYTSGNHVVIGADGTDPHTLAHELTHVVQQRSGPVAGTDAGNGLRLSDPSDRFEREAESNATRVMSAPPATEAAGRVDTGTRAGDSGAIQRAPSSGNDDQRRPWVPNAAAAPANRWFANTTPGRTDGVVLSGHGSWSRADGYFRVPAGTRLHFYTLLGQTITDGLGQEIEEGRASGSNVEQGRTAGSAEIYVGGRSAPNVVLETPFELTVSGDPVVVTPTAAGYDVELNPGSAHANTVSVASLSDPVLAGHSITVDGQLTLSQLIEPDMGNVHLAACRFTDSPRGGTRNQEEGLGP